MSSSDTLCVEIDAKDRTIVFKCEDDGDTGQSIFRFVRDKVLNQNRCIVVGTHGDRIFEFATQILTFRTEQMVAAVQLVKALAWLIHEGRDFGWGDNRAGQIAR